MRIELTKHAMEKIRRARGRREPIIHQQPGDNERRALRGLAALEAYATLAGCDVEDSATDLLTDLRHLGDRKSGQGTFAEMLGRSKYHYDDEVLTG